MIVAITVIVVALVADNMWRNYLLYRDRRDIYEPAPKVQTDNAKAANPSRYPSHAPYGNSTDPL